VNLYRRLLGYLRPYVWPHGIVAVIAMLAFTTVEGSVPFVAKYTFDQVFTQRHLDALPFAVVAVLAVSLLRGGLDLGSGYLTDWIGQRVVADMRNELTAHMQRLDVTFFNRRRAGQVVSRVMQDVSMVSALVTDAVTSIFLDATRLVALAGGAIYMDRVLAGLAVCLFPVAALPIWTLSKRIRQTSRRMRENVGRLNAMLHENVQGNRVVKVFGQEAHEQRRFAEHNERLFRLFMRASLLRQLPITEVLAGISVSAIVWYGGSSVIAGTRTLPDLGAFVLAILLLYEPFKKLVRTNNTIQQGLAGAERVFELLDTVPEVVDAPDAVPLDAVRTAIEFHDVSFAYEPGEPVLRHIDLRIPVGKVVALVGMSGGGKSTLADLVPRLYDVTEGSITIDGVDIRGFTLKSLRQHIAVVTQFTFLFNDTVRANIAYGDIGKPMDEIVNAARAANAHEFITALPQGYDTPIGELGVMLSGGQRQRLAIARALLKDAPILILDEATSALDSESERLVQQAIARLMVNRTSLVIAHRLSTIRRADRIVVVVRGQIVEEGTHEELLALGAEYRKLYDLQFQDPAAATVDPERLLH